MKKLFLTPIALLLAFAFGCQETSIIDPPLSAPEKLQYQNSELAFLKADMQSNFGNTISLDYKLVDPVRKNKCLLTGEVNYITQMFLSNDDVSKLYVKVNLNMSSQLCQIEGKDHPLWEIKEKSEDKIVIGTVGADMTGWTKFLAKTYTISNRVDAELCVTYEISPGGVSVKAVGLNACKLRIFNNQVLDQR
jgi:hypothetical protein